MIKLLENSLLPALRSTQSIYICAKPAAQPYIYMDVRCYVHCLIIGIIPTSVRYNR